MKCRKGQRVLIKDSYGENWHRVVKGCNEKGYFEIYERFPNGWCQKTIHHASEILEVKK